MPVVDRTAPTRLVGLITQFDLLEARQKLLEEERHAERVLTMRRANGRTNGRASSSANGTASGTGAAGAPAEELEQG